MTLADRIAKREETDRAAYEIIDKEADVREEKTERLRRARLASLEEGAREGGTRKAKKRKHE